MRPHAAQAGQQVLVLGQTHLQATFLAGGMQREDVQDERRAVDDLHVASDGLFEVRLLRRSQLVVEHHQVGGVRAGELGDLFGFAGPHERARVGRVELLRGGGHHVGAGSVHQTLQFGERRGERPRKAGPVDAHEHGALAAFFGKRGRAPRDDGFEFGHGDPS